MSFCMHMRLSVLPNDTWPFHLQVMPYADLDTPWSGTPAQRLANVTIVSCLGYSSVVHPGSRDDSPWNEKDGP